MRILIWSMYKLMEIDKFHRKYLDFNKLDTSKIKKKIKKNQPKQVSAKMWLTRARNS